jgi:hypothetical protein
MGPTSYLSENVIDPAHHAIQVPIDFFNPDSNHSVAFGFEPGVAAQVIRPLMVIIMVRTVDFDHESGCRAIKVDKVLTDWLLTTKLPATNPPASKSRPHPRLGPTQGHAKLARYSSPSRSHLATVAFATPKENAGC